MEQVTQLILEDWYRFIAYAPRIIMAVTVLIVSYFTGRYSAKSVITLLRRASIRDIHENFIKTLTISLALFIGLIVGLNIVGLETIAVSVIAGGGVTAIVIGFAFREIGENFLAGTFLAFSRPFKIGDRIRTEDIEGKVQEIELRSTHLRTDDGRDIYVPSSQLFTRPVTNFTKDGLLRISFSVGIDYSNDSKSACGLLQKTVEEVNGVLKEPGPGSFILNLSPQYVEIQVFYWVDMFDEKTRVNSVKTDVMDACRNALLTEGYVVSSETTANIAIIQKG
jgi:small-conductance mechanosensitive channel